jgi:glycosyltransferase involved in cell wall biosynthesis
MSSNRISVVIPVHDRIQFLPQAIESILDQSGGFDLEVIIVDDGSTKVEVASISLIFPMVRVIHQECRGVCAARQAGSDAATGDFIAYLDDDDLWMPSKSKLQMQFLKHHPDVGIVGSDLDFFSDSRQKPLGWFALQDPFPKDHIRW